MVDTGPLDLANFLARNRQAGGINRQLADVLAGNLGSAPQVREPQNSAVAQVPGNLVPGMFGVGRGDRPERPRVGGGSALSLAGMLTGGATFPLTALAGFVANDALGNEPSPSLIGALRSVRERDRPERPSISRPDRIRSASNREIGGGFTR